MRDGFRDIVSGWTLVQDVAAIGEFIEEAASWTAANGGEKAMLDDERATVRAMIRFQVGTAIRMGEFEPFIPRDLPDEDITAILNFDA